MSAVWNRRRKICKGFTALDFPKLIIFVFGDKPEVLDEC